MREQLVTAACLAAGAITGRLASRQDLVPPPDPRVVLIRRCCLGDVLWSTAALDALRRRYPGSRIDFATSAYAAPALLGNPDVSNVIAPDVRSLRRGRYDVAVVLERSPRPAMTAWLAGVPIRVGPNSLGRGFACNLPVACPADGSEAELALACVRALGVSTQEARAKFCPPAGDASSVNHLLPEGPFLVLAPGGGVNPGMTLTSKRWPADRFAALAAGLELPAVLIGGNEDGDVCQAVAREAEDDVVDLCGRLSFSQAAAVIQQAALFVGNDSAPLHLAAAVGTPFVGIFGPSDPVRHRPFGAGEIVAPPLPRGAYHNGFAGVDCIAGVRLEDVLAACQRRLPPARV